MSRSARFLAERSYLYFKYNTKDNLTSKEFYLPMLENPDITESQKPNLATYDILGRPGSLYAYLGSKSREFTLKFKITLPHVYHYIQTLSINPIFIQGFRTFTSNRDNDKRAMRGTSLVAQSSTTKINHFGVAENEFNYHIETVQSSKTGSSNISNPFSLDPKNDQSSLSFYQNFIKPRTLTNTEVGLPHAEVPKQYRDAVNLVILWMNIIRTCVVGSAENTSLGPPLVYINHGSLYGNIPCICTNYSFRFVDIAGYDLISLTPRSIEITLNLSENRIGNFEAFEPFKYVEGENAAGWESVINYGTIDPHNSLFSDTAINGLNKEAKEVTTKASEPIIKSDTLDSTPNYIKRPEENRKFVREAPEAPKINLLKIAEQTNSQLEQALRAPNKPKETQGITSNTPNTPKTVNDNTSQTQPQQATPTIKGPDGTEFIDMAKRRELKEGPVVYGPKNFTRRDEELAKGKLTLNTYKSNDTVVINGKVVSDVTRTDIPDRLALEQGIRNGIRLTPEQVELASRLPYSRLEKVVGELEDEGYGIKLNQRDLRNPDKARARFEAKQNPEAFQELVTSRIKQEVAQLDKVSAKGIPVPTVEQEANLRITAIERFNNNQTDSPETIQAIRVSGDFERAMNDTGQRSTPDPKVRRSNE